MRPSLLPILGALAIGLSAAAASARTFPLESVPPDLAPWIPWVLDEVPQRSCVTAGERTVCVWPTRLSLALDARGGTFALEGTADAEADVTLPGDPARWPQDVVLGDRPIPVLAREQHPSVRVPSGAFRLRGRFAWAALPESLPVPATAGLIDLSVDGNRVDFPRRDAQGLLWIQARTVEADEGERLDLEVSRRIADGVPMTVHTRIVARASGRAREVDLGRVVLDGTVPLSLESAVPARLDADGNLRVQVRAGTWKIDVVARTDGTAPAAFGMPKRPAPWPGEETWVWQADEALRQVTLTGGTGVDPSRTSLDDDWKRLPARILRPGEELAIRTERRGEPEPPPSAVQLNREIWMDTNGQGYTLRDRLEGTLNRTWRLDLQAPAVLGHAVVEGQDQLVTLSPETNLPGVEVRGSRLDLVAESRIEGAIRTLPAVGWSEDASSLRAILHLAPGWRLLSASGVDSVRGTWIETWSLLGFLFVLLMALAVGRLAGWPWGVVTLLTLALNHGEAQEPFLVWISLVAVTGLLLVAPDGRFRTLCRWWWMGTVAVVALETVPFIVREVREGIHPQVAGEVWHGSDLLTGCARMGGGMASRDAEYAQTGLRKALSDSNASGDDSMHSKTMPAAKEGWAERRKLSLQNDPNAVVQTGPGVPTWEWEAYALEWSGPVDKGHSLRLWLLAPWQNLLLALIRVALTLLLAVRLVSIGRNAAPPRKPGDEPAAAPEEDSASRALAGMIALGLLAIGVPSAATAVERGSLPDRAVLDDLKARLTRPESCLPDCTSTSRMTIDVAQERLHIAADVHAGAAIAWPVPGPAQNWVPGEVLVDGKAETGIALLEDGFLHLRLAAGTHRVELSGPAGRGGTVTLEFADTPHRVEVSAPGWTVEGLREDGRVARSVQLLRKVDGGAQAGGDAGADADAIVSTALPPWLEVNRVVDAGIPWLVHTTVRRASPTGTPVVVRIPLLPGESVTESELRVEAGHVIVSLGRDDTTVAWESTLDEQEKLVLEAPRNVPWSETWVLWCSPVWQCAPEGLAPVHHQSESRWRPEYRPWPGEKLSIGFRRPAGAAGQTVTIDRAVLHVSPGTRLQSAMLELEYRSSQGGVQTVNLPAGARVTQVAVGSRDEPIQEASGRVAFSLQPGAQKVTIHWQQTGGMAVMQRSPSIELGAPAANARMTVKVPSDRWLLFCGGPTWGPAVLYWGFLLAFIAFGFVLGRVPASPLRGWQWVLLFVGLANVPIPAALVVVGWFLLLKRRADKPPATKWRFDWLQIVLVGWTIAAAVILYATVHTGLLQAPGMRVAGMGSSDGELVWYADRIGSTLPAAWVLSVPRWVWRIVMLAWSFWLAWSLVKWVPWAWRCFSTNGLWWKIRR